MKRSIYSSARGLLASALLAFSALAAAQAPFVPTLSFSVEIPVGESSATSVDVYNPNAFALAGVGVQIPMPPGFSLTSGVISDCTITSNSTTPGGLSVVINMPSSAYCSIFFSITASAPGLFNVTGTATVGTYTQDSVGTFLSYQRATIGASFSPNPVAPGSSSTLAITITNPDPNHDFTVDGGDGGNAFIRIGTIWSSAVVTGTSPLQCAEDYYTSGPPYIADIGDGPRLLLSTTLPPGASCVVTVEVISTDVGSFTVPSVSTTVSTYYSAPYPPWYSYIYEDVPVTPATLVVRVATGPLASFSPARLDFGSIPARGGAGPLEAMFTNTGTGPLSILGIDVLGGSNFGVTHNCLATLLPENSCTFFVTFSGTTPGPHFGEVKVSTNAPGSPHVLGLTGTVVAVPIGLLSAAPSLAFEERIIGTTSAPQAVTITNTGDATATITGIGTTGDFAVQGTCPSLAPGATCTVQVTFKPTATGTRAGQLQVASNAANPVLTVRLTGVGAPLPAPAVSLSPASLEFGERVIGARGTLAATLTNSGNADLVLGAFEVVGDFLLTHGCPATLAARQSCRLDVEFIATVPGRRTGEVRIASNAPGSPHSVGLAGRGCRLAVTGRSFSLDCGR